jgi:hypothetical protein
MQKFVIQQLHKSIKGIDSIFIHENEKNDRLIAIYPKINFDIVLEKVKTILLVLIDYYEYSVHSYLGGFLQEHFIILIDYIENIFKEQVGLKYYRKDILDNQIDEIVERLKYLSIIAHVDD